VIRTLTGARWRSLVLVISLAMNLFFGGLMVARHAFGPPRGPDAMLARLIGDLSSGLSERDRATLRRIFDAHEAEIKERSAKAVGARASVRTAIGAEPFDPAVLTATLEDANARDTVMRRAIKRMLLEAAIEVSPEGRRKLATWRPLQR